MQLQSETGRHWSGVPYTAAWALLSTALSFSATCTMKENMAQRRSLLLVMCNVSPWERTGNGATLATWSCEFPMQRIGEQKGAIVGRGKNRIDGVVSPDLPTEGALATSLRASSSPDTTTLGIMRTISCILS